MKKRTIEDDKIINIQSQNDKNAAIGHKYVGQTELNGIKVEEIIGDKHIQE